MNHHDKIITIKEFLDKLGTYRQKKQKIVLMTGSFDLFHIGHLNVLEQAKNQGDVLIILLNSDSSIKQYKGKRRPIFSQKERSEIIASIEYVDHVIIFDDLNPKKYIRLIRPDVFCNGLDWGKHFVGEDILKEIGAKTVFFEHNESSISASNIIKRIIKIYKYPEKHGLILDKEIFMDLRKDKILYKKILNSEYGQNIYLIYSDTIKKFNNKKSYPVRSLEKTLLDLAKNEELILNHSYLISSNKRVIKVGKNINTHPIYLGLIECAEYNIKNIEELDSCLFN